MRYWLVALSLLCASTSGCDDKNKDESEEDDSDGKKKTKKKRKKGENAVYLDCGDAPRGSSKTAEAKNTVGAISRGAAAAYERELPIEEFEEGSEGPAHRLCKSANPVPADGPPKGTKYQPNTADGEDFEKGDSTTGWRCLKFAMTQPHYYQYGYTEGSGYKSTKYGPARSRAQRL